jgi:lysophospholipase L1-like esterase
LLKTVFAISIALNLVMLFYVGSGYRALSFDNLARHFQADAEVAQSSGNPPPGKRPYYMRRVSQFEELPVTDKATVFLGDSITEEALLHELLPGFDVRNRGIRGDRTTALLSRIDEITRAQPEKLFLLIGTNDLRSGASESEIVANVLKLIEATRLASSETEIYVQSVLPRGAEFRDQIELLNRQLEEAIKDSAVWINLYPVFVDTDGSIRNTFSNDELHLNGRGYLAWRDQIRPYLAM